MQKVQYAVKLLKMFAASPREIDEFVVESIREYLFSRDCSKVTVKRFSERSKRLSIRRRR